MPSPNAQAVVGGTLDFAAKEVLTFDCYGTLIDWESAILNTVRPVLRQHGLEVPDCRI